MESNSQQYVNAVLVRGPNLKDAFIVTEHPMKHTMGRAWKLAFTRYASAWVFLHDHTNQPDQEVMAWLQLVLYGIYVVRSSPVQWWVSGRKGPAT